MKAEINFTLTRCQCYDLGSFLAGVARLLNQPLGCYPEAPPWLLSLAVLGHCGFAQGMLKRVVRRGGMHEVTVRIPRWQVVALYTGLLGYFQDSSSENLARHDPRGFVALLRILIELRERLVRRRGQHGPYKITPSQARELLGPRTILTGKNACRYESKVAFVASNFAVSERHVYRLLAQGLPPPSILG